MEAWYWNTSWVPADVLSLSLSLWPSHGRGVLEEYYPPIWLCWCCMIMLVVYDCVGVRTVLGEAGRPPGQAGQAGSVTRPVSDRETTAGRPAGWCYSDTIPVEHPGLRSGHFTCLISTWTRSQRTKAGLFVAHMDHSPDDAMKCNGCAS